LHDYIINNKATGRWDHVRKHENYVDEEIKTVSAQQAETIEVSSLYADIRSLS